jgi:PBP1b-binding outer membrane lipoprotein LpoB
MKFMTIFGIIFALGLILLFSGCVSNQDTNDNNTFVANSNLTQEQTDLINKANDIANTEDYKNAIDENKNNESKEQIEYCIIDMGEVTQEFWFSEEYARMYTQGKDNFTDKVIDKDKQCTTNEKGQHVCLPLEESFESLVDGWKTIAQVAGKCNAESYDIKVFKTLIEQ